MSDKPNIEWSELPTPADFVNALGELDADVWRTAAFRAIRNPASATIAYEIDQGLVSLDPIDLWNLFDDLEAALHRFYSVGAFGTLAKPRDLEEIRVASRRAIALLASRKSATAEQVETLVGPFLTVILPSHDQ